MNECYISADIETTGKSPARQQMIELGACLVADITKTFSAKLAYFILHPREFYRPEPEALKVLRYKNEEELLKVPEVYHPIHVLNEFSRWIKANCAGMKPVFVAHNAPFDWMFVCHGFDRWGIENPFGHSALDMKAYFMGQTGCSWSDTSLRNMAAHAGIPFEGLPHRALDDAIIQARVFAKLLERKHP